MDGRNDDDACDQPSDPESDPTVLQTTLNEGDGGQRDWLTRRLRVSINRHTVESGHPDADGAAEERFLPLEFDVKGLFGCIQMGYAYSAELDGASGFKTFAASNLLTVVIDGAMTLPDALAHPFIAAHATFIYTTVDHTEDRNSFICPSSEHLALIAV